MHNHNSKKMITQKVIKLVSSLGQKKQRNINELFLAEGNKIVSDFIDSDIKIKWIIATEEWLHKNTIPANIEYLIASTAQIKKMSQLTTPTEVIAVCHFMKNNSLDKIQNCLAIALDNIQDPGNLGTIIRLADWFGISNIICSNGSADQYNPKVIQATMGAIARVNVHHTNLHSFITKQQKLNTPIYGTFLEGENIYQSNITPNGIVIMGNEGKGISDEIASLVNRKLLIPNFSEHNQKSESLNVSMATGIILSEFKRRN